MNFWTTSLLITLLSTSTVLSGSINCTGDHCLASFAKRPTKKNMPAVEAQPDTSYSVATNTVVEYSEEEEFVAPSTTLIMEETIQEEVIPTNERFVANTLQPLETETIQEPLQKEEILDENSNSTAMDEEEGIILLTMSDMEYVCEEGRSVICDAETQICECA